MKKPVRELIAKKPIRKIIAKKPVRTFIAKKPIRTFISNRFENEDAPLKCAHDGTKTVIRGSKRLCDLCGAVLVE